MRQATVLEQIKELDSKRDALREEAKKDALGRAEAAIAELNELGFAYFLGSEEAPQKRIRRARSNSSKSARHKPKDAPCPICNYRTDPPHDRRSHRSQKRRRPFKDQELEAAGMTRL